VRDERIRFTRRTVVVEPGTSRSSHDAEWRDAIVMVECGDVELECAAGGRRRFAAGAVLWLTGIDIRVLHNVGVDPVVLVAFSRRRGHQPHAPP
jgi:quercetin dioxygenase-like cupin family protein